jgi:hypothetical protein
MSKWRKTEFFYGQQKVNYLDVYQKRDGFSPSEVSRLGNLDLELGQRCFQMNHLNAKIFPAAKAVPCPAARTQVFSEGTRCPAFGITQVKFKGLKSYGTQSSWTTSADVASGHPHHSRNVVLAPLGLPHQAGYIGSLLRRKRSATGQQGTKIAPVFA